MNVIGFSIKEILATRDEKIEGRLNINNNVKIKDVTEDEIPSLKKKCLVVKYEYKTEYSVQRKKVAEIKIIGSLLLLGKNHKKILEEWKKKKTLPDNVNLIVINSVLRRGILKAMQISEDLQLLPPIPLPVARPLKKEDNTKYIG